MAAPLLATKLFLPSPTPDLVSRPLLDQRLEAGLGRRLTLISAPAGFGKTTLVSGWLRRALAATGGDHGVADGLKAAWLSLEESDDTPAGFWTYLISAVQTAAPQAGEAARAAFQSPQPPRIESVLVSLINDLAGLPHPLALVLDDFHAIASAEIHSGVDFLLEHLPQQVHLVIITREDPPIALSRLRARDQMVEIRAADLQFSAEETDTFLNRLLGLGLSGGEIRALAARTEGWVTGLRLASLALRHPAEPGAQAEPGAPAGPGAPVGPGAQDRQAFIDAFTASHRFLTDYLVDEVLSRLDAPLRLFLYRTSILHRFSAGLCDAVLDGEASALDAALGGSQQVLHRLEAANLFLVPLDNERTWYRYHHLFAQFLRLRLAEAEPGLAPELYRRAADWHAGHGLPREALAYALEGKDYERAADLIEQIAPRVLSQEGAAAVLQWMDALPEALRLRRPWLCLHYAWALTFSGSMSEAEQSLDVVAALLARGAGASPAEERALRGYLAAHRTYLLFFHGEHARSVDYGREAMANLPAEDEVMRARTAAFLGNGLRYGGDLAGAQEAYDIAAAASQKTGNIYTAALTYCSMAEMYCEQGHLRRSIATYRLALEFARQHAGRPDIPFTGLAYSRTGRILREWNDLPAAREHMDQGIQLCREWRQADTLVIGLMERSFLLADLGAYGAARRDLQEAREIVTELFSPWGIEMTDALIARLDLAQGDLPAAARWEQAYGFSPQDEVAYEHGDAFLALARLRIAQGAWADALAVLDKLYRLYAGPGRWGTVLVVLAWQARALAGLGDIPRALEALRQAMAIGEPEGYTHSFVEAGPAIAELLRRLPPAPYRDHLLAAFEAPVAVGAAGAAGAAPAAVATPAAAPGLPEPLSEREMAVLRLLAAGRSNAEIGAELYLSVNTIRWYASQIYQKLGAGGRGAAVAKARALGIL